jgi:hypothetical protein
MMGTELLKLDLGGGMSKLCDSDYERLVRAIHDPEIFKWNTVAGRVGLCIQETKEIARIHGKLEAFDQILRNRAYKRRKVAAAALYAELSESMRRPPSFHELQKFNNGLHQQLSRYFSCADDVYRFNCKHPPIKLQSVPRSV